MNRSEQREQAFYLVFEHEFLPKDCNDDLIEVYNENIEPVCDFAKKLYLGVLENKDTLDETISQFSKGWKLSRLPKVTLSVLRIAIVEIDGGEVPSSVAINEAVELSKKFGSKDDASFVNGILGAYSRSKA